MSPVLTKEDNKRLKKEARKRWKEAKAAGKKPPELEIHFATAAFYQGTELPDGQCAGQGSHACLVFPLEDQLNVSLPGGQTLVVPYVDVSCWRMVRTSDLPGYKGKSGLTKTAEAVLGGSLVVAGSAAEEEAKAERQAVAVTYTHSDAESTVYLTFRKDKDRDKLQSSLTSMLGAPEDTPT